MQTSTFVARILIGLWLSVELQSDPTDGQASAAQQSASYISQVERAVDQSATGQCEQALPVLKKLTTSVTAKDLKYKALMATVRCALNRGENQTAANALFDLKRDYP